MLILGIETSCDETAAAVASGKNGKVEILSDVVSSQIEIHKKYGGVVPEVAAREHVLNILPVIDKALKKSGIPTLAKGGGVDAIAVTIGPGLITSLVVGIETAKVLSCAWGVPVIGINHIEGHVYANFINQKKKLEFPAMILTVSGGHTMLVLMRAHGKYKTIGETRDDAAGEAFDKAAKLMGIGYPGGPAIAVQAVKCQMSKVKGQIKLPRPMINSGDFDFSFSGLKTALLYDLKKDKNWEKRIPEYCHEFQRAVVDTLVFKTVKAAEKYKAKTVMLAGGVAANTELRTQLEKAVAEKLKTAFVMPDLKYTTDNAAMVASAGYFRALKKDFTPWEKLRVDCNLELK
ncbi:MAG: tRNA (adenosine(37)-N6)-threonylcarbamoyltransferase complex transferase subunit TsaD [Candidatus Falkowbacteria bacterium]